LKGVITTEKYIDTNCHYYDYGNSAPIEYGEYCSKKRKSIEDVDCSKCSPSEKLPVRRDYLGSHKYPEDYKEKLDYIRNKINKQLIDNKNYRGIDFYDVSAGGIQIRGFHRQIKGYCYPMHQVTLFYDFSNIEEAITEFINCWNSVNNEKDIQNMKWFLASGKRWGWD